MKTAKIECPSCHGFFAVPHADDELDLVHCQLGCPSCGKHLYVQDFGELVVFDENLHTDIKPLPKED